MKNAFCAISLVGLALVCVPLAQVWADEPIGLFAALQAGDAEAKLILRDETAGRIVLTNKTKRPLTIKLPEGFAGVPVQAQLGIPAGGNNNRNNGNGNGSNQGVGAGQLGGQNGGIFSIEPEKAVKIKVVAVCLEHGKREPNPYVAYRLMPLEEYTSDVKVIDVVRSLARGDLDQKSAQAAAWHLANGLSWKQLAHKIGIRHLGGRTESFFTSAQLERAYQAVETATQRAEASVQSSGGQ